MADEVALSLPFSIDPYGKVASTHSQQKIWSDRVLSVIGTTLRERVMNPAIGTIIPYAVFDSIDDAEAEVRQEVEHAFSQQLGQLTLTDVVVTTDSYNDTMKVTITYDLPNNQKVTTTLGLISISGTKPAYEEIL
jgi:phage baseplate assembly protein W